jgi:type II secretion system protein N
VSGRLNGVVSYSVAEAGEKGDIRLALTDLAVRPQSPLFNITEVTFNQVQAEAVLGAGRRLEIRKCNLAGPQLNGAISGAIRLANDPAQSALDLTGSVKPHPGFLAEIGQGFPASLLLKNRSGGASEISFRIRGTIENPAFSLL